MAKRKDWNALFQNVHPDVAETLAEAKATTKRYYRHYCATHGDTVFTTLDNACPHCAREGNRRRRIANPTFNRTREWFNERKMRAKERNIPFELKLEGLRSMVPERCPVLDRPLVFGGGEWAPSIDRLDNQKGYTVDNVRIISVRANRIKSDGTAEEHDRIATWMRSELKVLTE